METPHDVIEEDHAAELDERKTRRADRRFQPSAKWQLLDWLRLRRERRDGFDRRARVARVSALEDVGQLRSAPVETNNELTK